MLFGQRLQSKRFHPATWLDGNGVLLIIWYDVKILEYQQHCSSIFDLENQEKKWSIVLDKGYRITKAAC